MLNRSASFIWKQLEGGASREEILKALSAACGTLPSTAEPDLDVFLGRLKEEGYLAE